jgi:hypothetical protein
MRGHERPREDAFCSHLVPTHVPTQRPIGGWEVAWATPPDHEDRLSGHEATRWNAICSHLVPTHAALLRGGVLARPPLRRLVAAVSRLATLAR